MEFARLGVSLALPLLCKDDLIGMLALGEKPSRVLFVPVVVAQHRCGGGVLLPSRGRPVTVALRTLEGSPDAVRGIIVPRFTLANRVSLLSHDRHSLPVTVRRKAGALLAAYSTIR